MTRASHIPPSHAPRTWSRIWLRHTIRFVVLAMVVPVAGSVVAAEPAVAAPNVCGPWHTDQDIADSSGVSCRATFLVDPGQGNMLTREQLLAASQFYATQGFGRQWLWYAPMTTIQIGDTSTQQWTGCQGTQPRQAGDACGNTQVNVHLMSNNIAAPSLSMRAFAWDGRAIVRACGNYLVPSNGGNPVPTAVIEKYDDRNRNGVRDPDEAGLPGWQFRVERIGSKYGDQATGPVATVATGADGLVRYAFDGAGPGTYAVEEIGQDGWAPTTAARQTFVVEDGIGDAEVTHLRFGNAQTRADLAKVDFSLVDPPQRMDAHSPTDLTVQAVIRNDGPADVTATDTLDVATPPDCLAEPAHAEAVRTLTAGASASVEFRIRVTCDQPSYHPLTFTDHLLVTTAGVEDPVPENNTKAFQQVFEVYDRADIQLSGTSVTCPTRADVGATFDCTVTATVTDAGPYGPVTVDVTFGLQPPADCHTADLGGGATQSLTVTPGDPRTVTAQWRTTCTHRSFHDMTATASAALHHLHVEDPVAGNATGTATTRIPIFEPADLAAQAIDLRCNEREANPTASSCTAQFSVRNNGPATNVAILTTLTITPEPDCTATPTAPQQTHLVLAAAITATVTATWQLTCTQTHRHSVRVTGTVTADEPHAEDRVPGNNTSTTVWLPTDVKPRSLPSSINIGKEGVVPFALLSTPTLNTVTQIDQASLRFGRTGTENSLISCAAGGEDVNDDGRLDLVCRADTQRTGIDCATTVALITGQLTDGTRFQSEDTIKVLGCH